MAAPRFFSRNGGLSWLSSIPIFDIFSGRFGDKDVIGSIQARDMGTPAITCFSLLRDIRVRYLGRTPITTSFWMNYFRFARRTVNEVFAWRQTEKSLRVT